MKWIADQSTLDAALASLARLDVVAVDTEADSLHSYFDKVCLIQISGGGEDLLIDPLGSLDLSAFGRILADPAVTKILHGADYDLRILGRDFGFDVRNLVDTMVCAQLLGYEGVGLAALLKRHFGLELDKSHQRADWSRRPLEPALREYAATDTRHLIELAAILRNELEALGRWSWAEEEFRRLEAIRFVPPEPDPDAFRKIKGCNRLERRSLAAVERLHAWRDGEARKLDRPPFKVLNNETIVTIATELPRTEAELKKIKGVSGWHLRNWGSEILGIVEEVVARAEDQLPEKRLSKPWFRDKDLDKQIETLRRARDRRAEEHRIDPSMLAPKHVLASVAALEPSRVEDLDRIPAMREWQKQLIGEDLIGALKERAARSS